MAQIKMLWVIFLFLFFVVIVVGKKTRTKQNFKGEKKRTNIISTRVQIKLLTKIQIKLQKMCKKIYKQTHTQEQGLK